MAQNIFVRGGAPSPPGGLEYIRKVMEDGQMERHQ